MFGDGIEDLGCVFGALDRKIATLMCTDIDDAYSRFRHRERRQPRQRGGVEAFAPFLFGKIKRIGRQRLIRRAGAAFLCIRERLLACLAIILDLRQALGLGQRLAPGAAVAPGPSNEASARPPSTIAFTELSPNDRQMKVSLAVLSTDGAPLKDGIARMVNSGTKRRYSSSVCGSRNILRANRLCQAFSVTIRMGNWWAGSAPASGLGNTG